MGEICMAAATVDSTIVGKVRRHQLVPPIHAMDVDAPGVALCGAPVAEYMANASWSDDEYWTDRCEECIPRFRKLQRDMPEVEESDSPFFDRRR